MAYQHGATREEVAETAVLAVYMGGGPAAVYAADALRAYDQFAGVRLVIEARITQEGSQCFTF
jgi:alkylhydroperoxidase/carboxymuconolactone decarboxylase family protein YurZ